MNNQWGYMNPETYVAKPKFVKGLGFLEVRSSEEEESDSDSDRKAQSDNMMTEMKKFLADMEKDETAKVEKEKIKKKKKEEKEVKAVDPNRWGPWVEYFDQETKHAYFFNVETKETVWKLSESTKQKYKKGKETEDVGASERKKSKVSSDDDKNSRKERSPSPRRRDRDRPSRDSRRRSMDRYDREKETEKKCLQLREKLNFFKFNRVPKSIHKLTVAHLEIECRFEDFQQGKLDADYFSLKLKEYAREIKLFEDTAAPSGYSLLWDEADKKYGYINNFTGEVTTEYPTTNIKPKKPEDSFRKNVADLNSKDKVDVKRPWKYSDDGSISGVLGGSERKKIDSKTSNGTSKLRNGSREQIVGQTDILKDTIHIEKAKREIPFTNAASSQSRNEKEDRRLARLGIQIDTESKSPETVHSLDENEDESTEPTAAEEELQKQSDGNMEISSESETENDKKPKRKKRKKEKNSKNKKSKLGLMENWKKRQEDEQASLWNQLGI